MTNFQSKSKFAVSCLGFPSFILGPNFQRLEEQLHCCFV